MKSAIIVHMNAEQARGLFSNVAKGGTAEVFNGLLVDIVLNQDVNRGFHQAIDALADEPDGDDVMASAGFFRSPESFAAFLARREGLEQDVLQTVGETTYGSQILEFVANGIRHTIVPARITHIVSDYTEASRITAQRAAITMESGFGHMPILLPSGAVAKLLG